MKENNVILDKTYAFALRTIKLYMYIAEHNKEYVISKQVLRSGTSIGANVEEAVGGQSTKDFAAKMSIAYKEARETHYWLRLLRDSDLVKNVDLSSMLADCDELLKVIESILKTIKAKSNKK